MYDIANPRKPRRISTFGRIAGTWTEKTIVRRVHASGFDGVLAVTSVQACENGFGGFALYDVTGRPTPLLLARVPTSHAAAHEIWLATARGHALVYTAGRGQFSIEPTLSGSASTTSGATLPGRGQRLERLRAPPLRPLSPPPGVDSSPRPLRDHEARP